MHSLTEKSTRMMRHLLYPLSILCFTSLVCVTVAESPAPSDCQDGWSSCDSSLWVSSTYNSPDPLTPYAPGDVRGPLEYEVKFSCRGRRNGYYADLDHSCKVWHYCNTTREIDQYKRIFSWTYMHYSYVCPQPGTRYDQVLRECVPESKAIVRCQESELYYPKEDYVSDVPIVVSSNNRLVPVRCPTTQSGVKCQIQNDHIKLKGCPESPGVVVKFYSSLPEVDASSYFGVNEVITTLAPPRTPSSYSSFDADSDANDDSVDEDEDDGGLRAPAEASSSVAPPLPIAPPSSPVDTDSNDEAAHPIPVVSEGPIQEVASTEASVTPAPRPLVTRRPPIVPRGPALVPVSSFGRPNPFRFRDTPEVTARKTIVQNADVAGNRKHLSPVHSVTNRVRQEAHDEERVVFPPRSSHTVAPAFSANDEVALPITPVAPVVREKLDTSFNCNGRVYGYYADVKNECKIYHVCAPKLTNGVQSYQHYSFICADGLVFDQQRVTCVPQEDVSLECSHAESYYANRLHHQVLASPALVPAVIPSVVPAVSPVRAVPAVNRPVSGPRTVTVLTVRSTGKHDGAHVAHSPSAVGQSGERGRQRGDQSPADEEEVHSVSPVPQPPAVHRASSHGTKSVRSKQVNRDSSAKKLQSPSAQRQAYLQEHASVSPRRKVVYRLKKNLQAPIAYSDRAPYISGYPKARPSAPVARKSSQLVRSPSAQVVHRPKTLRYSSQVSHVIPGNNNAVAPRYITPLVSPARTVSSNLARSSASPSGRSYGGSPRALSHYSPSAFYPDESSSVPLGSSSRIEDAESSLYW